MSCAPCDKKTQRHSEIEDLKYCAVDDFYIFCPFPIQSDRQCLYLHVFTDKLLTFTEFFVLLQKRTGNCIVYKRLQHCKFFRQRYCCLGKTNINLISKLHKTYFGKLQKPSQFLPILRFLRKKRQA